MPRIPIGAKNKDTGKYAYPRISSKEENFICVGCGKKVILCKGEKIPPYFRHYVDNNKNSCTYLNNPGESQIHKDAKLLIKSILEDNKQIIILRRCSCCKNNRKFEIPNVLLYANSEIILEYPFNYKGQKFADVAYVLNSPSPPTQMYIFELFYKNKTIYENRPEPWFEIDAKKLIIETNNGTNINDNGEIEIRCIRDEICINCENKHEGWIRETDEMYVELDMRRMEEMMEQRKYEEEERKFLEKKRRTIEEWDRYEKEQDEFVKNYYYMFRHITFKFRISGCPKIYPNFKYVALENMRSELAEMLIENAKNHCNYGDNLKNELPEMIRTIKYKGQIRRELNEYYKKNFNKVIKQLNTGVMEFYETNNRIKEAKLNKICDNCRINYCKCKKPLFKKMKDSYGDNYIKCVNCNKSKCKCSKITDFFGFSNKI